MRTSEANKTSKPRTSPLPLTVVTGEAKPDHESADDRIESSTRPVDLPEHRTLLGQGATRPVAPGRPRDLAFGAALPAGRNVWQDNDDLFDEGVTPQVALTQVADLTDLTDLTPDNLTLVSRVLAAAENGDPEGDPSGVYVHRDGRGGRRQLTLGIGFTEDSGNLRKVIEAYVEADGRFAVAMRPFINRLGATPNLSGNTEFKALLKTAGRQDPTFARVQREMFQSITLEPARRFCEREKLTEPLSFLVVADSYLHSGGILSFLRRRFPERTPKDGGNEKTWIKQYVDVRHRWLENHSRPILRKTIYRTRAWREQIGAGNWHLAPPIGMNGIRVDLPSDSGSGGSNENALQLTGSVGAGGANRPDDVRAVKARLKELGFGGFDESDRGGRGLNRAIELFQSIVGGRQRAGGDGRIDVDRGTQRWLEASNAPKWKMMPVGDRDGGFFNYEVATQPGDHHDFGTSWLADTITGAGEKYFADHRAGHPGSNPILVNDSSLPNGHDTPDHSGHETGLSADLRLPNTAGDQNRGTTWRARDYDRAAMRAMLQAFAAQAMHGRSFFNDPVLIREGLCVHAGGHDNHAHIEVRPPQREA